MELTLQDKHQLLGSEDEDRLINKCQRPDPEGDDPPTVLKRRLPSSEEDDCVSVHKRQRPGFEDDTAKHALRLMQDFSTRFDDARFGNIERSITEVTDRLDNLQRSITEMKDKVEGLDTDHTPCRLDSEFRQDIIQEVMEVHEENVLDLKWTYEDVTKDLGKYCDKAKTDVREACNDCIGKQIPAVLACHTSSIRKYPIPFIISHPRTAEIVRKMASITAIRWKKPFLIYGLAELT